jgi:hypothetical protein
MIAKLLQILEENQGEMDLVSLSRQLDVQPSAVAGIFQFLIQKGRVIELDSDCGACSTCYLNSQCPLPIRKIKRYRLSKPNTPELEHQVAQNTCPANAVNTLKYESELRRTADARTSEP